MSALRLTGSTSGYSEITPPAIAGDQTFTLPGTGGTLDRLNRAGNILQVVNATYSTQTTSSSSTFADTGLTASITPSSSSNKILVIAQVNGVYKESNNTGVGLRLVRASTTLFTMEATAAATGNTNVSAVGTVGTTYVDTPSTTSSTTYKIQFNSSANLATVYVQLSSSTSTITLLEVAA
jgi:hypothetical protein